MILLKTIRYSLTFLGAIEVPDNATNEEIRDYIQNDFEDYYNFDCVNDVEWSEEAYLF